MADLTSYTSLISALFVRIQVDAYSTTGVGSYTSQVLKFSDHSEPFTINSEVYTPLGNLLSVSKSVSELRPSSGSLTITLSGIPDSSIAEIIHSKLKGAPVSVYRAFFTIAGSQIGETEGRFIGNVNNYSLEEDFDPVAKSASNLIQFECLSNIDVLQNKVAGRRTNPESMQAFYSSDTSFNRVPGLVGAQYNFGADK
jgi:hypothetical protein